MKRAFEPIPRVAAATLAAASLAAVVALRAGWVPALIALLPLLVGLEGTRPWARFAIGSLFSAAFHAAVGASWTTSAVARFSHVESAHAAALVALFIGWQSLGFGLGFAASAGLQKVRVPLPLALGATVMATEWVFPQWLPLSLAVAVPAESLPGQLAAFGGTPLVAGWCVLGAATLASWRSSSGGWRASVGVTLALLALGASRFNGGETSPSALTVGLVQSSGVVPSPAREHTHAELAGSLMHRDGRPDLVVWGEGSVGAAYTTGALPSLARRIVRSDGAATLFGADVRVQGPAGEGPLFNSALLADADGVLVGRHDKVRLLGLGETLALPPFDTLFGRLLPRREAQSYAPGPSSQPAISWRVGGRNVAIDALLCLEDIYPLELPLDTGEGLLVSLSNDAWFMPSLEARLHDALARYRAVESGRAFVRVASGGLSAVYDPHGRQGLAAPEGQAWAGTASVPLRPASTPFLRMGASRLRALAAITLAFACLRFAPSASLGFASLRL